MKSELTNSVRLKPDIYWQIKEFQIQNKILYFQDAIELIIKKGLKYYDYHKKKEVVNN